MLVHVVSFGFTCRPLVGQHVYAIGDDAAELPGAGYPADSGRIPQGRKSYGDASRRMMESPQEGGKVSAGHPEVGTTLRCTISGQHVEREHGSRLGCRPE